MSQTKKIKTPGQKGPVQNNTSPYQTKQTHIRTQYEKNNGKSETIQHDAYTVRELLERFTINTGYPVADKKGTFAQDADHQTEIRPDANDFDLTDETIIKDESQLTIDQAISEQKQLKKLKQKEKEDQDFQQKLIKHEKTRVSEANSGKGKNESPIKDAGQQTDS